MKTILLLISLMGAIESQASTHLSCVADNAGAVGSASARVLIQDVQNGRALIQIEYVNSNFNNGIAGNFDAKYDALNQEFSATGSLGPVKIQFYLTKESTGNVLLVVYGDPRIEHGFGADLLCK